MKRKPAFFYQLIIITGVFGLGAPIEVLAQNSIPFSVDLSIACPNTVQMGAYKCLLESLPMCGQYTATPGCGISPPSGYSAQLSEATCESGSSFNTYTILCKGNYVSNANPPFKQQLSGTGCITYRYASFDDCAQNAMTDCRAVAKTGDCGISANLPNGTVFNPTSFSCDYVADSAKVYDYYVTCIGTTEPQPQPLCQTEGVMPKNGGNCGAACTKCAERDCFPSGGYCAGGAENTCYNPGGAEEFCDCGEVFCNESGGEGNGGEAVTKHKHLPAKPMKFTPIPARLAPQTIPQAGTNILIPNNVPTTPVPSNAPTDIHKK